VDGRDVVLKGKIEDREAANQRSRGCRQPQMIADCGKADLELRALGVEGESLDLTVAALAGNFLPLNEISRAPKLPVFDYDLVASTDGFFSRRRESVLHKVSSIGGDGHPGVLPRLDLHQKSPGFGN